MLRSPERGAISASLTVWLAVWALADEPLELSSLLPHAANTRAHSTTGMTTTRNLLEPFDMASPSDVEMQLEGEQYASTR